MANRSRVGAQAEHNTYNSLRPILYHRLQKYTMANIEQRAKDPKIPNFEQLRKSHIFIREPLSLALFLSALYGNGGEIMFGMEAVYYFSSICHEKIVSVKTVQQQTKLATHISSKMNDVDQIYDNAEKDTMPVSLRSESANIYSLIYYLTYLIINNVQVKNIRQRDFKIRNILMRKNEWSKSDLVKLIFYLITPVVHNPNEVDIDGKFQFYTSIGFYIIKINEVRSPKVLLLSSNDMARLLMSLEERVATSVTTNYVNSFYSPDTDELWNYYMFFNTYIRTRLYELQDSYALIAKQAVVRMNIKFQFLSTPVVGYNPVEDFDQSLLKQKYHTRVKHIDIMREIVQFSDALYEYTIRNFSGFGSDKERVYSIITDSIKAYPAPESRFRDMWEDLETGIKERHNFYNQTREKSLFSFVNIVGITRAIGINCLNPEKQTNAYVVIQKLEQVWRILRNYDKRFDDFYRKTSVTPDQFYQSRKALISSHIANGCQTNIPVEFRSGTYPYVAEFAAVYMRESVWQTQPIVSFNIQSIKNRASAVAEEKDLRKGVYEQRIPPQLKNDCRIILEGYDVASKMTQLISEVRNMTNFHINECAKQYAVKKGKVFVNDVNQSPVTDFKAPLKFQEYGQLTIEEQHDWFIYMYDKDATKATEKEILDKYHKGQYHNVIGTSVKWEEYYKLLQRVFYKYVLEGKEILKNTEKLCMRLLADRKSILIGEPEDFKMAVVKSGSDVSEMNKNANFDLQNGKSTKLRAQVAADGSKFSRKQDPIGFFAALEFLWMLCGDENLIDVHWMMRLPYVYMNQKDAWFEFATQEGKDEGFHNYLFSWCMEGKILVSNQSIFDNMIEEKRIERLMLKAEDSFMQFVYSDDVILTIVLNVTSKDAHLFDAKVFHIIRTLCEEAAIRWAYELNLAKIIYGRILSELLGYTSILGQIRPYYLKAARKMAKKPQGIVGSLQSQIDELFAKSLSLTVGLMHPSIATQIFYFFAGLLTIREFKTMKYSAAFLMNILILPKACYGLEIPMDRQFFLTTDSCRAQFTIINSIKLLKYHESKRDTVAASHLITLLLLDRRTPTGIAQSESVHAPKPILDFTSSNFITDAVKKKFPQICKNEQLLELLEATDHKRAEGFIRHVTQENIEGLTDEAGHLVWKCSAAYEAEKAIKRYVTTDSIVTLAIRPYQLSMKLRLPRRRYETVVAMLYQLWLLTMDVEIGNSIDPSFSTQRRNQ